MRIYLSCDARQVLKMPDSGYKCIKGFVVRAGDKSKSRSWNIICPVVQVTPQPEASFCLPVYPPRCPKNVHTGTLIPSKLPASPPLQPDSGRDLGCLPYQGTRRVTQIYLQHSSISLRTRCCWLRETRILRRSHNNLQTPKNHGSPSSVSNITFLKGSFASADIICVCAVCIACMDVLVIMQRLSGEIQGS